MSTERYDVVVVGASIAGMAFVLALRDAGLRIAVLDAQESFDERVLTWGHDLEPNGLLALEFMGVLDDVKRSGALHYRWNAEHAGGGELSRWDYDILDHSHPYAVCIRAHVLRVLLRDHGARVEGVDTMIPGRFEGYERSGGLNRVRVSVQGGEGVLEAPLLVGADGPGSRVRRAAGIPSSRRPYKYSWVDTIMARDDGEIDEGYIYFGRGEYLGIVPTRARELVTFQLTKASSLEEYKAGFGSIEAFRRRYVEIAPILAGAVQSVESWDNTTVAPGWRMRAERWVRDGVALAGDSTLTVNPITSQGVCLALEAGVTLAAVVKRCFSRDDFSARALAPYEALRRPQAEAVQRIGDYCLWGFASRNPVVSMLKTRMLSRLASRPEFRRYVMASFCGLYWLTPKHLDWMDALTYTGVLPKRRAQYRWVEETAERRPV